MFGALKKLFSKPPVPAAAPPSTHPVIPAPAASPSPVPLLTGDLLHIPLNDVLSRLPPEIAPLVLSRPAGTFSLPVNTALEQLHTGAVKIPFRQLRQAAPPGTFANKIDFDEFTIDLPLAPILAAVGPSVFSRRPNQTRIEVPDTVSGVFGTTSAPPSAAPVPLPAAPSATKPAPPVPIKMPEQPKLAAAAVSQPVPLKPTTSIAPAPAAPKAPTPPPIPFPAAKPAAPVPATPLPFAAARPSPPPSPTTGEVLSVGLDLISVSWPEAVRQEITQLNLSAASVSIPMPRLEAGMKTGRILFSWAEIRGWIDPAPSAPSAQGGTSVELPLKVLAPLFMTRRRPPAAQKKVAIGENIPDLFAGLIPSPAPVPSDIAPTPAAPAPAPVASPPMTKDAIGEIFGQPQKRDWTIQEIAQQISALDGVAASIVTTSDGLLVAGQTPAPWKAETLAGFLPQIFARMTHYSNEAELGTLHSLTLNAGQAPWTIFTAGPLFMAVLGQPGHALPEAVLKRIAGELAKRNP